MGDDKRAETDFAHSLASRGAGFGVGQKEMDRWCTGRLKMLAEVRKHYC
jgi:hypothetical protein